MDDRKVALEAAVEKYQGRLNDPDVSAASFIYIALADLIPDAHRHTPGGANRSSDFCRGWLVWAP